MDERQRDVARAGKSQPPSHDGVLHVVAVGVDLYQDPKIHPLTAAGRDAAAVADLFGARIRADEQRIQVLRDGDATRAAVMDAIGRRLVHEAAKEDVVFLYFACHGSPERIGPRGDDRSYLVMHDTQYEQIYATGISMETTVVEWFQRLRAKLVILVLDACFSGAAGGRTFGGPCHERFRDAFFSDEPLSLRDFELGHGRAILAAAQDHEVALESLTLGHGIFTYHLLEILRTPPPSEEQTIGIGTLAEQITSAVARATNGAQVPLFHGKVGNAKLPYLGASARVLAAR
jgi:uncharacterized caspase-like protein